MQVAHTGGDPFGSGRESDSPTGHGVGLRDSTDRDRLLGDFLSERSEALRGDAVNQSLIDFVRHDPEAVAKREGGDFLEGLAWQNCTGWVAGRVKHQHFGSRRDRVFKLVEGWHEASLSSAMNDHRHAFGEFHLFGISHPVRGEEDDLVAGFQKRLHDVVERVLGTAAHDDLIGRYIESVFGCQFGNDRVFEILGSGAWRVFCEAFVDGIDGSFTDRVGRVEVRLSGSEGDDIFAFGTQGVGFRGNREGGRGAQGGRASRKAEGFHLVAEYIPLVTARALSQRARLLFIAFPVVSFLLMLVYVRIGAEGNHGTIAIAEQIFRGPTHEHSLNDVVWQLRLPRGLTVALVGAILGLVGCAFQALFRNPLADPYIVGVSSGSAVGGALALIFGFGVWLGGVGMLAAGFVGGMLSLILVYGLARKHRMVDVQSLLLAGVTVAALLSAVLSFILMLAGKDTTRILGFLLGHTSDSSWTKVGLLFPTLVIGLAFLYSRSRRLNALAVGEASAERLGVDVKRLTQEILVVGTAMTAAAVGAVGIVGFVGLVAPHLARRIFGVDWRVSLPGSALIGTAVMLLADLIGQRAMSIILGKDIGGMEVNVGIVSALLGAPSLLILLRRSE